MLKTREVSKELMKFNSLFYTFQYKHHLSTVFDDLLTVIICAMARETQESLYLETIKKYTRKELYTLCELFGELMKIYALAKKSNTWRDPLGEYYECLASNHKKSNFGQFFTPYSVCNMMAKLTVDSENFGLTINEPASGSGRMVLAANHIAKGNYYICEDLDPICCKMTAINLCFHDIRAEIHCHDTIERNNKQFSLSINHEFWKHNINCIFLFK